MKPHITITLTAWCDWCVHWEYLEAQSKYKGLIEMLKKGWKCINGRYACPNCVERLNKKKNNLPTPND